MRSGETGKNRPGSLNILLAEDNPINRKLAKHMFDKTGYNLDTVENGKEAVERFKANPEKYHLIFRRR